MRRDTRSMQNIRRMCICSMLDPDAVLHKSTLVMQVYRDVYQKNNIAIQGFEKTELPDSFFDLAIGNVPLKNLISC